MSDIDRKAPTPEIDVEATVNGRPVRKRAPTRMLLVDFLRDRLGLTGAKVSCAAQVCGACSVLVDGEPVSSCAYLAADIDGREVLTVEGLAGSTALSPVQQAFVDCSALQCGYCTPGFVIMATALLRENPNPTEAQVAHYLEGNLCRCTGYLPIVEAVLLAARRAAEVPAGSTGPEGRHGATAGDAGG
ncbi:MAG: (2Fe-2S)-binding protein [Micromonosporaceae bacterium]